MAETGSVTLWGAWLPSPDPPESEYTKRMEQILYRRVGVMQGERFLVCYQSTHRGWYLSTVHVLDIEAGEQRIRECWAALRNACAGAILGPGGADVIPVGPGGPSKVSAVVAVSEVGAKAWEVRAEGGQMVEMYEDEDGFHRVVRRDS